MENEYQNENNPYASGVVDENKPIAGVDYLLVSGNVNLAKDKGMGLLLLTPTSVFGLRTNAGAAMTGAAVGGLLGALIGHFIDKRRAKKRPDGEHMQDPDLPRLDEKQRKQIENCSLVAKLSLDQALLIERTKMGFKFAREGEDPLIFQGMAHKRKVMDFLAEQNIEVR